VKVLGVSVVLTDTGQDFVNEVILEMKDATMDAAEGVEDYLEVQERCKLRSQTN